MNRIFSFVFIIVFLSSCSLFKKTPQAYKEKDATDIRLKKEAVIDVYYKDFDGNLVEKGHAFIISPSGIAYTNSHILPAAKDHFVKIGKKEFEIEKILAQGEKNKIVKFKISNPKNDSFPNIDFAEHPPYNDDVAHSIGRINGEYVFSKGIVSTVMFVSGVGEVVLTDIPVFDTIDGAPLLNNSAEVIGVFSVPLCDRYGYNMALSLENFDKLEIVHKSIDTVAVPEIDYVKKYGKFYDSLKNSEIRLQPICDSMIDGWNMFVRIDALTDFIKEFKAALKIPGSYNFPFDSLTSIKIIESPDQEFKIYNWILKFDKETQSISNDKTFYRYQAVIQFNNPDSLEYVPLFDGKKNIEFGRLEDTFLYNESWFGVQYYDIKLIEDKEKKYYILLGWDGYDNISDKKVIEVLSFDTNRMPVFGAPIFKMEDKVLYRKVFQYNDVSVMALQFMPENNAIVFDHLVPRDKKLEGKEWLYIPDGTYNYFKIKNTELIYKERLYKDSKNGAKLSKTTELK